VPILSALKRSRHRERAHVLIRWPAATHCLSPPFPCSAVFRNVPRGPAFTLEQLSLGPRKRQRNFGGHVLVIAGSVYCFGCRCTTFSAWRYLYDIMSQGGLEDVLLTFARLLRLQV
jgi:hypothetical protein